MTVQDTESYRDQLLRTLLNYFLEREIRMGEERRAAVAPSSSEEPEAQVAA